MYPYSNVVTKRAFELAKEMELIQEQPITELFELEVVKFKDLPNKLFGLPIVAQAHIFELFEVDGEFDVLTDTIIAELDVDSIDGFKEITDILNESFEILNIDFKYPFRVFIPDHCNIRPKRIEFAYIQLPLIFTEAYSLYMQALKLLSDDIENPDNEEFILFKLKGVNDENQV